MTEMNIDRGSTVGRAVKGRRPAFSIEVVLWAAFLALVTFGVFHESLQADFVQWDDDLNIYLNPYIQKLDWPHLRWMFTDCSYMRRYVPMSWLNWAFMYHFFGLNPTVFHLESLLLHAANAVLVFALIRMLFQRVLQPAGASGVLTACSGLAALLWALHPLRTEAVAWANCEIYPQSILFLFLSLICYLRAIENQDGAPPLRTARYWLALLFFALSLLTYPTGIPLVIVLLVLNIYPLGRLPASVARWSNDLGARRVLLEIIPFALITIPVVVITLWARLHATGIWEDSTMLRHFGWDARLSQAFYIWAYYLWRPWLPFHLSTTYTTLIGFQPMELRFLLSAAMVVLLSVGLFLTRRRVPMLWALWLCHLGILVPMLGLTEPQHTSNDRYSYLPGILWSVLLTYGLFKLWSHRKIRIVALTASVIVAASLAGLSVRQTRIWRNSEVLFRYIISELGNDPYRADLYLRLGDFFSNQGRLDEAKEQFEAALRITPRFAAAHDSLAVALVKQGKVAEAIDHYQQALQVNPASAATHYKLATALWLQGNGAAAVEHYRETLRLQPDRPDALNNLAWILATHPQAELRNGAEAVSRAERACKLTDRKEARFLGTLDVAYAETGRFAEAIATAREARDLAMAAGQKKLAAQAESRLKLYESGQAYHAGPTPTLQR